MLLIQFLCLCCKVLWKWVCWFTCFPVPLGFFLVLPRKGGRGRGQDSLLSYSDLGFIVFSENWLLEEGPGAPVLKLEPDYNRFRKLDLFDSELVKAGVLTMEVRD